MTTVLAGALRGYDSVEGKIDGVDIVNNFVRLAEPPQNSTYRIE